MRGLEQAPLPRAEAKGVLQPGRLAWPLGAEKDEGGVGGHDGPLLRAQEVAGILGREHQRAVVLADAPGEAHDEAADGRVLEEQPELIDDEHPSAVFAFDPRPQRFCEQEVDGRHHLVAQLAHAEDDDRRLEIDVGGSAEHPAQAAVDPAVEDDRDPRGPRHALGDVAKHGLGDLVVRLAGCGFDERALRLVKAAAHARAEVDCVGGGGSEPGFVVAMLGAQVEDVEGGSGAEGELDVDAAEPSRQAAVLVLGIDDEDLGAGAERAYGKG